MGDDAPTLDVPDDYDGESYRAGYAAAMAQIGQAALQNAELLSPGVTAPDRDDEDADPTNCPDCGAPLLDSMGADETTAPAGTMCPECEL